MFGWTADEKTSFELLDGFVAAGLNAVDTADIYSAWAKGNQGGESETIIGKWFRRNPGNRARVVLITKVGSEFSPERGGLSARWITQAIEDSLRRLQTDTIDLYLSHRPDPHTPYEETLAAFEKLLRAGKIRAVGASNLDAGQLAESLAVAKAHNLPRYDVLQPEYNLYDRASFDGDLRDLTMREGIGVITYFSLAKGFLSGKYRATDDLGKSPRRGHRQIPRRAGHAHPGRAGPGGGGPGRQAGRSGAGLAHGPSGRDRADCQRHQPQPTGQPGGRNPTQPERRADRRAGSSQQLTGTLFIGRPWRTAHASLMVDRAPPACSCGRPSNTAPNRPSSR